jgi:hypothetical protein
MKMEWRISRQRRRIGHPYWLQFGFFGVREDWRYNGLQNHWVTEYEEDYATLKAAKAALQARQSKEQAV